jgi:hypothetical protein
MMHSFYSTLLELKPAIASLDEFKDPKNQPRIKELLKGMAAKIDQTTVKDLKAPGFNATYGLLAKHLRDTSYLYEKEIYDTAWNNFRATTQFCIACHDRLPKGTGTMNWPLDPSLQSKDTATRLREADFFYIGHQFDQALEVYDNVIRTFHSYPKAPERLDDLRIAYQRKIAFYSRIKRDPKAAIQSLKQDAKNEGLPLETKKDIETWIQYFDAWKKEGAQDPTKFSDSSLVDYARTIVEKSTGGRRITVSDPFVVNLLRVSGLLYERVFKKPKSSSTPEMLYLLAKCEQDLAPVRPYSLADIYYKECILQAPHTSVSKKCFSEYEVSVKQRFRTGASDYINQGIEALRKEAW